jgi:hypothetical protein
VAAGAPSVAVKGATGVGMARQTEDEERRAPATDPPATAPAPPIYNSSLNNPGGQPLILHYPDAYELQLGGGVDTGGSSGTFPQFQLAYRRLVSRSTDVGGAATVGSTGPLQRGGGSTFTTGSLGATVHVGTPGRSQYEPWGMGDTRYGAGFFGGAGLSLGQGPPIVAPPLLGGSSPGPTLGTARSANPYANALLAQSFKAGKWQFDVNAPSLSYSRFASFRGSGPGANVENALTLGGGVNVTRTFGNLAVNAEGLASYSRATPLTGGAPFSAYDFKWGAGAGVGYSPGPYGVGLNVMMTREQLSNMGSTAAPAITILPSLAGAF